MRADKKLLLLVERAVMAKRALLEKIHRSNDYCDATAFEVRVAVLLAKNRADGKILRPKGCSWYETTEDGHLVRKTACPPRHDIDNCPGIAMCSLYHARIAAEAKM